MSGYGAPCELKFLKILEVFDMAGKKTRATKARRVSPPDRAMLKSLRKTPSPGRSASKSYLMALRRAMSMPEATKAGKERLADWILHERRLEKSRR